MTTKTRIPVAQVPHSWDLEHWPEHVYPHTTARARYLVRAHLDELVAVGAVSRVGRERVILGARYSRWLETKTADVPGFSNGAAQSREAPQRLTGPGRTS